MDARRFARKTLLWIALTLGLWGVMLGMNSLTTPAHAQEPTATPRQTVDFNFTVEEDVGGVKVSWERQSWMDEYDEVVMCALSFYPVACHHVRISDPASTYTYFSYTGLGQEYQGTPFRVTAYFIAADGTANAPTEDSYLPLVAP